MTKINSRDRSADTTFGEFGRREYHSTGCDFQGSRGRDEAVLPLRTLEEILYNTIKQKKGEMHKSHNKAYLQNLHTEIETLQWVLTQILTLLRQSSAPKS